jgi:hypothetical protein
MDRSKPKSTKSFDISKNVVLKAYEKVKANKVRPVSTRSRSQSLIRT